VSPLRSVRPLRLHARFYQCAQCEDTKAPNAKTKVGKTNASPTMRTDSTVALTTCLRPARVLSAMGWAQTDAAPCLVGATQFRRPGESIRDHLFGADRRPSTDPRRRAPVLSLDAGNGLSQGRRGDRLRSAPTGAP
jgi:hypothetical protein